ncbi:MAG: hypothetical protein KDI88_11810 [Gammaproteobacteria bacterium]|nr:hypothetical protein [Gammaproteobacteria bacterium]
MLTKTLATLTGVALLTGAAIASPNEYEREDWYEQRGPLPFEVMDLDGDGVVTAEEHANVRQQRQAARQAQGYPMRNANCAPAFEQIDANRDGAIDKPELEAWQAQRMRGRYMAGPGARW